MIYHGALRPTWNVFFSTSLFKCYCVLFPFEFVQVQKLEFGSTYLKWKLLQYCSSFHFLHLRLGKIPFCLSPVPYLVPLQPLLRFKVNKDIVLECNFQLFVKISIGACTFLYYAADEERALITVRGLNVHVSVSATMPSEGPPTQYIIDLSASLVVNDLSWIASLSNHFFKRPLADRGGQETQEANGII